MELTDARRLVIMASMKLTYTRQPVLVVLLVTLLVVIAISGSYMLYRQAYPGASGPVTTVVPAAAAASRWDDYATHEGGLHIRYPVNWSVSEAPGAGDTYSVFIDSPDRKTSLVIIDNKRADRPAIKAGAQLLASDPATFMGKPHRWNYLKTTTGNDGGTRIEAHLMTNDTLQAAWPRSPDLPEGRISIFIRNYDAKDAAQELRQIADVAVAKRIAESIRSRQ